MRPELVDLLDAAPRLPPRCGRSSTPPASTASHRSPSPTSSSRTGGSWRGSATASSSPAPATCRRRWSSRRCGPGVGRRLVRRRQSGGPTRPVAELRDTARRLGLVRVHRNELRPTTVGRRLADDPVGLWRHIAAPAAPRPRARRTGSPGCSGCSAVAAGRRIPRTPSPRAWARSAGCPAGPGRRSNRRPRSRRPGHHRGRSSTGSVSAARGVTGTEPPAPSAVALARAALLHEEPPAPAKVVPAVELTVTLRDVDPPVWRRLVVPERATLRDLDRLLQAVMGWQGTHLSMFELDGRSYGDVEDMDELGDPRRVRLGSVPDGNGVPLGLRLRRRLGARRPRGGTTDRRGAHLRGRCRSVSARGQRWAFRLREAAGRCLQILGIPSTPTRPRGWDALSSPTGSTRPRPRDGCDGYRCERNDKTLPRISP